MEAAETKSLLDFPLSEYTSRLSQCRRSMEENELDALLLSTDANFRYLTGFDTQFWVSPSRPWYLVIPREGDPVAVVPGNGGVAFKKTSWVSDVVTFPSPRPGDDGVTAVANVLNGSRRVGAETGPGSRLGLPLEDFLRLRELLRPTEIVDGSFILNEMRQTKSAAEIAYIQQACSIGDAVFAHVSQVAKAGMTERELCRALTTQAMSSGADAVRYLPAVSGQDGYRDAISGPTARKLSDGDILYVDTGVTVSHYFCDFNRNWALGDTTPFVRQAYEAAFAATVAGIEAVRPGVRACDIWAAIVKELGDFAAEDLGRMGHGVGLDLTEPPSIMREDTTEIVPGMVLAIEPCAFYGDQFLMVHEEDVLVTETGSRLLTSRAPEHIPVI